MCDFLLVCVKCLVCKVDTLIIQTVCKVTQHTRGLMSTFYWCFCGGFGVYSFPLTSPTQCKEMGGPRTAERFHWTSPMSLNKINQWDIAVNKNDFRYTFFPLHFMKALGWLKAFWTMPTGRCPVCQMTSPPWSFLSILSIQPRAHVSLWNWGASNVGPRHSEYLNSFKSCLKTRGPLITVFWLITDL